MGSLQPWAQVIGAIAVATVAGVASWLAARAPLKGAKVTAEAAWQTAMNDGFEKLTAQYETANAGLAAQVAQLDGTVRDLVQHIESLEKILRDEGLPIPARKHPLIRANGLIVINGDKP